MYSVALIGMPGAGKSTAGVLLARDLALNFIDTDLLIQQQQRRTLQQIIDDSGYQVLRQVEEQVILDNDFSAAVVATGGSAVYGSNGMNKLKELGQIVYLSCPLEELSLRIQNFAERGIAADPKQSFEGIALEREKLYRQYADVEVKTDGLTPAEVVNAILALLK